MYMYAATEDMCSSRDSNEERKRVRDCVCKAEHDFSHNFDITGCVPLNVQTAGGAELCSVIILIRYKHIYRYVHHSYFNIMLAISVADE